MSQNSTNQLGKEASAYLQQHKDNPVHWWAYTQEAIDFAKTHNRPIFLSVGYSACHWCHVMAHESFESQEIADILNRHFVSIKVDKEEFPDLDNYYQQACQFYTRSGGWPLSAFLLPDMRPFFVGTYFPAKSRPGLSSFKEVLLELARAYKDEQPMLQTNAQKVTEALAQGFKGQEKIEFPGHFPPPASILNALKEYQDNDNGGWGQPPKFPHFAFLEWCSEQMLEGMVPKEFGQHVVDTVEHMLLGGIYDHARGGIHRYSTDATWSVPHFEKMLYDQAGLLSLLSKFSMLYAAPCVLDGINDTLDYLHHEMLADKNYFFSAQDADSEGVEGLYFTFTLEEFEDLLNRSEVEITEEEKQKAKEWMKITKAGNFDHALNIITLDKSKRQELYQKESWDLIRKVRKCVLNERRGRIPPSTDNKGVASWNFLMLTALLDVVQYGRVNLFKEKAWSIFHKAMEGCYLHFIKNSTEKEAKATITHVTTNDHGASYFEDYVFFAEVQIRAYELSSNKVFKDNFIETMKTIEAEFKKDDGYYTRALGQNDKFLHPNQKVGAFDGSFKSPLSTYIHLIRRFAVLTGSSEMLDRHKEMIEEITQEVLRNPLGAAQALRALTYPDSAYRVVKVPMEWSKDPKFRAFTTYFMSRFVFDFVEEEKESWQICTMSACEIQGLGLESLQEALIPKNAQDERPSST